MQEPTALRVLREINREMRLNLVRERHIKDNTPLAVCEGCGEHWSMDEEQEYCYHCRRREIRLKRIAYARSKMGQVLQPFFIVAYGISRHYGGPEEGGWWYDVTEILEARKCWTWQQGLRIARELRKEHPTCPRGRGSVIGGQDVYIHCFYDPDNFPTEGPYSRPRYE